MCISFFINLQDYQKYDIIPIILTKGLIMENTNNNLTRAEITDIRRQIEDAQKQGKLSPVHYVTIKNDYYKMVKNNDYNTLRQLRGYLQYHFGVAPNPAVIKQHSPAETRTKNNGKGKSFNQSRQKAGVLKNKKIVKPVMAAVAGILAVVVSTSIFVNCVNNNIQDFDNDPVDTSWHETQQPDEKDDSMEAPEFEFPEDNDSAEANEYIPLDELQLECAKGKQLTSDSLYNLSNSLVEEIRFLYNAYDEYFPTVLNTENLCALFYFENSGMTEQKFDPNDKFIGIGQVGVTAVEEAIERSEFLYNKALSAINKLPDDLREEKLDLLNNNYFIKNLMGQDAQDIWERCKTDAKLCGAVTTSYLAHISGRNYTAYEYNPIIITMMYNCGVGNIGMFVDKGLILLSSDKKEVTFDLSKVNTLKTYTNKELEENSNLKNERRIWNEAISYVIRIQKGASLIKENPNADIVDLLEDFRLEIGSNDNSGEININQYKYLSENLNVIGLNEFIDHNGLNEMER